MDKDILIEELFNKWVKENEVEKRKIVFTTYVKINPCFSNYDSWKLASKEDYYKEENNVFDIDLYSLYQYISKKIKEDYDLQELIEKLDTQELFMENLQTEFFSSFNNYYSFFEEDEIEKKISNTLDD